LTAPLESLDTAALRHASLDARVRGVTVRAGVDDELTPGGASRERLAARGAADGCEHELRMDLLQEIRLLRWIGRQA